MSEYIVSARKYRPDSFETLVGQDNIAKTLKNSILRGQLAHAYLFCGPRGVGKTSAARIFAKTINCENPGADLEPCGECESCLSFKEGRSYCIHELDAASNNGVEDIKNLMEQVQIPPQTGRYSVYIIDEVHMLSSSAFNAFLKTLEEPPAHAIFILATTEKHKIIPTILSRCQTYDFNRISIPDIVSNLSSIAVKEGITIDEESLHVIAHKADGAMRDALTLFDQSVAFCGTTIRYEDVLRNLNVLDYEYSFRLVDYFLGGDYASAMLLFDEVLSKGFNALYFVSALAEHLRDLLVSRTAGLDSLLDMPASLKKRYKEQADKCSVKFLYEGINVCSKCEASYRGSANQRLHIELALMNLSFLNREPAAQPVVPSQAPVSAAPVQVAPVQTMPVQSVPVQTAPPAPAVPVQAAPAAPEVEAPVAEKPAPAAPKKASRFASSLSLSSLMNEKEEEVKPEVRVRQEVQLPSDDALKEKWNDLALKYAAQPRLSTALAKATLIISESEGKKLVEFSVTNEAQKKWIEEKMLRDMENKFCAIMNCGLLRLEPYVIPDEEKEDIKYMPAEKADDLIKRNEEVRDFVIDLGLDIR
ncbi:MAG: DNA polymerase III subunit gamma/tau [Bacteroidales bacterium]|nr:DNA polymerase III subunit gamma/tau [Bacteroidales bacterium]